MYLKLTIALLLLTLCLADADSREQRRREREQKRAERPERPQESSSSRSTGGSSGGSKAPKMDRDVVVLEDGNFDENVFNSKDSWFVEFYAPWCGHCKNLEPEWFKVASSLKGKVKIAKVDSTVHTKSAQRFGVQGYPTLKFFPAGSTRDKDMVDYSGGRDASSLTSWAREQAEKYKPLEITQLVSQAEFDEQCVQFQGVCVIVILPHIYDSSKAERDGYINVMKEAATKFKGQPISYAWSQGGDNYEFEEAFQSGGAYPSVMALSTKKSVYAKLKGVFNSQSFTTFVDNVRTGKESFVPFRNIPTLKKVTPWDGKDHKPPRRDDDDL